MTDEKDDKDDKDEKKSEPEAAAPEKDVSAPKEEDAGPKLSKDEKAEESKKDEPAKKKKKKNPADAYKLPANSPVAKAWMTFAGLGLIGIVGAGVGYTQDPTRFAYAWLFGFICALTLAFGSMMFVMMHHITSGGWGIVVRRVAEVFGASSWVLLLLFIPIILLRTTLFGEWLGGGPEHTSKEHAEVAVDIRDYELASNDLQPGGGMGGMGGMGRQNPHGGPPNPHGGGFRLPPGAGQPRPPTTGVPMQHAPPGRIAEERAERVEHEEVMKAKSWYLTWPFFAGRLVAYFVIWSFIGWLLLKWSTDQDKTKDLAITVKLNRFSAPGIMLLVLSLTFAAFDWIMSLDPTWYSTIFGVTFFAGCMVCVFATLILTFLAFRESGVLVREVTIEHYHDLGKLLFGFMCFWAYVCFSQFMLIWYAAIPEELTFYHHRWDVGPWKNISLALVVLHFMFPFVFIMSRNIKRNVSLLRIGAILLLTMHVIDMYWLVMPNVPHQASFAPNWIDLFCLFGPVGIFLAVAFRKLNEQPLLPIGDPRLERSLHFVNA